MISTSETELSVTIWIEVTYPVPTTRGLRITELREFFYISHVIFELSIVIVRWWVPEGADGGGDGVFDCCFKRWRGLNEGADVSGEVF